MNEDLGGVFALLTILVLWAVAMWLVMNLGEEDDE